MSQRSEKLRRRVDTLEARMDAVELGKVWDAAEASAHSQAVLDAATERNAERRRAREAERTAAKWRRVAYIALVAAIIVEIIAILVIHANAACADENYKKGVTMTLDKAAKALETLHITEIEALNQPFDPNFMNAVQQVPAAEGQKSGSVVQVFQKGYKIGDKIIRHAMVVVAE